MSSPKTILSRKSLAELKGIAQDLGLTGYTKFRSANKDELVDSVYEALKRELQRRKEKKIPVVPSVEMPRSEEQCNSVPSRGGFSIKDLQKIAKEIGIDPKGMKKKELCEKIIAGKFSIGDKIIKERSRSHMRSRSRTPSPPRMRSRARSAVPTRIPSVLTNCNEPPSKGGYSIDKVRKIARENGIDPKRMTKKEICNELLKKAQPEAEAETETEFDPFEPKPKRSISPPKSPKSPRGVSPSRRVPTDLRNCNQVPSRGGFDRGEIQKLSENFGIDTKGLTKKAMCDKLMTKLGGGLPPMREEEVESEEDGLSHYDSCLKTLSKQNVRDLLKDMDKAGLQNNKPTKKADIIEYLCSLSHDSCDYDRDCADGRQCDISNYELLGSGLCVKDSTIESRRDSAKGLAHMKINGKIYFGTIASLQAFRKKYDKLVPERREEVDIFADVPERGEEVDMLDLETIKIPDKIHVPELGVESGSRTAEQRHSEKEGMRKHMEMRSTEENAKLKSMYDARKREEELEGQEFESLARQAFVEEEAKRRREAVNEFERKRVAEEQRRPERMRRVDENAKLKGVYDAKKRDEELERHEFEALVRQAFVEEEEKRRRDAVNEFERKRESERKRMEDVKRRKDDEMKRSADILKRFEEEESAKKSKLDKARLEEKLATKKAQEEADAKKRAEQQEAHRLTAKKAQEEADAKKRAEQQEAHRLTAKKAQEEADAKKRAEQQEAHRLAAKKAQEEVDAKKRAEQQEAHRLASKKAQEEARKIAVGKEAEERRRTTEVPREDIEDVLRKIKTPSGVADIGRLSDMQKKVLACLGLTS